MSSPHALMLVSAEAGALLRQPVAEQSRPCPEYLRLEDRHGVRLLDWSGPAGGVLTRYRRDQFVDELRRQLDELTGSPRTPENQS